MMTAELDWTASADTFDFADLEEPSYGWDGDLEWSDEDEIWTVELPPDLLSGLDRDVSYAAPQEASQDAPPEMPAEEQLFTWTCVSDGEMYS
jgi:hypothetical protein